jgi:hypothetical protein
VVVAADTVAAAAAAVAAVVATKSTFRLIFTKPRREPGLFL